MANSSLQAQKESGWSCSNHLEDVPNLSISCLRSGAISGQPDSLFLKAGIYGDKPHPDRKRLCVDHIRRRYSNTGQKHGNQ